MCGQDGQLCHFKGAVCVEHSGADVLANEGFKLGG